MSRFLSRSLFQVVAAVVLFAGVSTSELFAGTTYDVYAYTVGNNPTTIVGALYQQQFHPPYFYGYNQQPVNGTMMPFDIPVSSITNFGPGMNQYIYKQTLTNLTPGSYYSVSFYIRSGYGPGYTYTPFASPIGWTQQ